LEDLSPGKSSTLCGERKEDFRPKPGEMKQYPEFFISMITK
jgi:hypothetical protein